MTENTLDQKSLKKVKNMGRLNDALIVSLVILMSIAANLPEDMAFNFDKKYLMFGLFGIVAVSLIKYLKFTLVLVIFVLALGANLPDQLAGELGVHRGVLMFALGAMVFVSFANHMFKLPKGLSKDQASLIERSHLHGANALFNAIGKGRLGSVRALLQQGVNPNVKTKAGQTPLMYATAKGYGDIIQLLVSRGADVKSTDSEGLTAMSIAEKRGYTRLIEFYKSMDIAA